MFRKQDKRLSSILNKRVEVWHTVKSTVKDRLGQYPQEDKLYRTAYAGVIPQTGSLLSGRTADTTLSRTTHKIVMRYCKDITPDMWFMYDGVRYNILYIMDPYLDHERFEVFCEVLL